MQNSYERVRDPGNMRHIFQNNESFLSIVKETARLNGLPVDLLQQRVEEYQALETRLLAKQKSLIADGAAGRAGEVGKVWERAGRWGLGG